MNSACTTRMSSASKPWCSTVKNWSCRRNNNKNDWKYCTLYANTYGAPRGNDNVGRGAGAIEGCRKPCSSHGGCLEGLFCCPRYKMCMDRSTKSTAGPTCKKYAQGLLLASPSMTDVEGLVSASRSTTDALQ